MRRFIRYNLWLYRHVDRHVFAVKVYEPHTYTYTDTYTSCIHTRIQTRIRHVYIQVYRHVYRHVYAVKVYEPHTYTYTDTYTSKRNSRGVSRHRRQSDNVAPDQHVLTPQSGMRDTRTHGPLIVQQDTILQKIWQCSCRFWLRWYAAWSGSVFTNHSWVKE